MQAPLCHLYTLGEMDYQRAWDLQNRLADEIGRGEKPPALLLLQHPHTYTFGRRGNTANLLLNEVELAQREAHVHWVDRGGDVTYHGPGQIVGYPLLPLGVDGLVSQSDEDTARIPTADYIGYLRRLEETIIQALQKLWVAAVRLDGLTGVWIPGEPPAKIAAIGVKVDARGVTRHGFALNVDPDMSYWDGIIACGLQDYPVTCLADIVDPTPTMDAVIEVLCDAFERVFGYRLEEGKV